MSEKKNGKLIIISGPSGIGKTTISDQLTKDPQFVQSVSATTRSPRSDEKQGIDYFFVTKDEFRDLIDHEKLVEYAEYHNCFYGTPIEPLNDALRKGMNVLLVIEVKGALQIMKRFNDCISFFILPPNMETLKERLSFRNKNTTEEIAERISLASKEIEMKVNYQHCIVNDELENTVFQIKEIINKS